MGVLVCEADGGVVNLRLQHLVGRSAACHLRLQRAEVSGLHAALQWLARGWELRDLGSTNGTLLDGQRISPGERRALTQGSVLAFGNGEARWVLQQDSAPPARAYPGDGGPPVEERGGMLALPGPDDAEVLVVRADDGRWVAEQADGGVIEVGAQIRVRDQDWELELPEADPRTPMVQISEIPPLSLRFRVSPDEEYVDLVVRVGTIEHDLGARAHHYLLLTLARLRLRDQAARPAAVGEHGWVGLPRLTKMLRLEERPLNLQIFRIRRQFAELGVSQLTEIIERRRGTGQIRVGTAEVEILGTGG